MSQPYAILDSNIYIENWERGRFREQIEFACRRFIVRQCSVVLHELRRGAFSRPAQKLVDRLKLNSPEVLNPEVDDWWSSARILQGVVGRGLIQVDRMKRLQNDCLIALCARRIGGLVITADKKDFPLLESHVPCRVLYW